MEHKARKRFGQNFLQDAYIINSIVQAVNPQSDDVVVEIGPGLGAITRPLLERVDHLNVIEIDRDIIEYLKKQPFADRLTINSTDVLKFDFSSIKGKKKIVGNLPYNISTPLLFELNAYIDEIEDMHFMLQKEVVERMVAVPKTADYGRLSVVLQYFFDMASLFIVPPTSFKPAPKVESAVVRMIPNKGRIGEALDFAHFSRLVQQAFGMRRKTLWNNLKETVSQADFEAVGIDPSHRAEAIEPEYYVALSNHLLQKT